MQNQRNNGKIIFAELDTAGTVIECPSCHITIRPHLGNLVAAKFECPSCKAELSYMNMPGKTVRCPCCNFSRPIPNSLQALFCEGCRVTIIYQRGDQAVKCSLCNHTTTPPQETSGLRPINRGPAPVNHVVPPQGYHDFPPPANQVVPPQANQVVPPQANQVVPPQANQVVSSQGNQLGFPQVNRRGEAESSGSRYNLLYQTSMTDEQLRLVRQRAVAANFIAETLMTVARAYGVITRTDRRAEDRTEEGRSKKRSRDRDRDRDQE